MWVGGGRCGCVCVFWVFSEWCVGVLVYCNQSCVVHHNCLCIAHHHPLPHHLPPIPHPPHTPHTPHTPGIPPLVVAAGSFDDLVAICLYTLFISFALPPAEGQSQVYALLKGPLNIVLGVILGALGGLICCMSKIWTTRCVECAAGVCGVWGGVRM